MSSLSVLHEDRIKTSFSQQINKLTIQCNKYVLNLSSWETEQIPLKRVRENKIWLKKIQSALQIPQQK